MRRFFYCERRDRAYTACSSVSHHTKGNKMDQLWAIYIVFSVMTNESVWNEVHRYPEIFYEKTECDKSLGKASLSIKKPPNAYSQNTICVDERMPGIKPFVKELR